MFAHIYGADWLWLQRFKGARPPACPAATSRRSTSFATTWDAFEAEQRAFVDGLKDADLARVVTYKNTQGVEGQVPLGPLLQHVVNHATHHRSEAAAMITLISGSPPDTGIATYRATVVKG